MGTIRSTTFSISFVYKGKTVSYTVDKMYISDYEVKNFYRITAKTGNRDVYNKNGKWVVFKSAPLPEDILALVGEAIEDAEILGLPYDQVRRGIF